MSTPPPETTTPPAATPPAGPPPEHHEEHHEPPAPTPTPAPGSGIEGAIAALTQTVTELANLVRQTTPQKQDTTPIRRPWTHPAPRN